MTDLNVEEIHEDIDIDTGNLLLLTKNSGKTTHICVLIFSCSYKLLVQFSDDEYCLAICTVLLSVFLSLMSCIN